MLDYLQRFSDRHIPRWVLQADVCDALTLNNWLWWEDRRRELHFLKAGRDHGIFLTQLGAQVGVGKQGVVDRIDRLEALLRYDRPDEKITRSARSSDRQARERRPAEDAWLEMHRDGLLGIAYTLTAEADRYGLRDEDQEWIDELTIDAQETCFTPATMVILEMATAELRTAPPVLELDSRRPHSVHRAADGRSSALSLRRVRLQSFERRAPDAGPHDRSVPGVELTVTVTKRLPTMVWVLSALLWPSAMRQLPHSVTRVRMPSSPR